ncbi:helix-turn-helix domain-containing protein [Paractinoplanes durhamensis]|uniref:Transcriptional regulator n=1 Tax=Paractinoplanes durhamensis TaxID=113563 RepID=A0ABQ3ZBX0_9ACTN|nr:helix-turn-helix transcriptional regulator [Actinoplanes durhamensis]GIE07310.1 transcriptional regulator [Actinoplanes durhamensis]
MTLGRGALRKLGAELRAAREGAGLSGRALAAKLGNWSQAKVSRIENGVVSSTVEDIEAMLGALDVQGDRRERILALADEAGEATVSWRVLHKGGMARWQYELDQLLRQAARVRHFQPMLVPGLMQTAEYARRVLEVTNWTGQKDIDAAVVARLARQQILFEPGCPEYHYLLGEIGLRWRPSDSVALQRAQLDRVITVSTLPPVSVQVLPADTPAAALGLHGFRIYDFTDDTEPTVVFVETIGGEITVSEPANVATYIATWDQLTKAALSPDDSREYIRQMSQTLVDP